MARMKRDKVQFERKLGGSREVRTMQGRGIQMQIDDLFREPDG